MSPQRALVALDGALPSAEVLTTLRAGHDILVAADGAATKLVGLDIVPDVTIGDLDSIGSLRDALGELGSTVIEQPSQETGDFDKALAWIESRGIAAATIIGLDGGMIDHALNNVSVLARHARRLALDVRSGDMIGRCVVDTLEISTSPNARISLIPLPRARLTTRGLAWPLVDEVLEIGVREGASNRAVESLIRVEVHDGVVLVVQFVA